MKTYTLNPLGWNGNCPLSPEGQYYIKKTKAKKPYKAILYGERGASLLGRFDTLEEAQKACEDDYEKFFEDWLTKAETPPSAPAGEP